MILASGNSESKFGKLIKWLNNNTRAIALKILTTSWKILLNMDMKSSDADDKDVEKREEDVENIDVTFSGEKRRL